MTTKILALTDAIGNLVDFRLMPGQAHDLRGAETLVRSLSAGRLLAPSHGLKTNQCRAADRAFDADWLRSDLIKRATIPVIPPKSNRKFPAEFDRETCKWRHLIEDHFEKIK